MSNTNQVLTIAHKNYRTSEVIAMLAKARRHAAELDPTEYAHKLALADIAKFAPALEAAGIAEDAQIAPLDLRSLGQQRADAAKKTKGPVNPWRAVAAMDAAQGDINNLLRSNGNAAATEA